MNTSTPSPPPPPRKTPGLASIHKAREERSRGKWNRLTPAGYGWLLLAVVGSVGAYRFFSGRSLEDQRGKLLAKQRAAESELGPRWLPLRDKLEAVTLAAAGPYEGDAVAPDVARWDFRSLPGVYLRLRLADATDAASLRRAAGDSAKDGFTGCLLRATASAAEGGGVDSSGMPDGGAPANQAWNLRQAYASTRILTPEWVGEVKDATDDLRLRVFEQQYDKAITSEIPLAFEIVTRARFFLLVLDEDVPAAREHADGGAITEEALQLVPHPTRVHLVDLKTGKEMLRIRPEPSAGYVFAGEGVTKDPEILNAMQRQVNNCALAQAVKDRIK